MMELKPVDVRDFDITVDNQKLTQMFIPSGYVPRSWIPLLEENVVVSGSELRNGNVIILADALYRENPDKISPEYRERNGSVLDAGTRNRIQSTARWAIVTDFVVDGDMTRFNAVYSDGTIMPRSYNKVFKWAKLKTVQISTVCPDCGIDHDEARDFYEKFLSKMGPSEIPLNLPSPELLQSIFLPVDPLFDVGFIEQLLSRETLSASREPHGFPLPENSAEGETAEKVSVNPKNFKRRLRDASSLKQVANILKERDAYFTEKGEQTDERAETVQVVHAGGLQIGDIFLIGGYKYGVISLADLGPEFEDEINVEVHKLGATWPLSLTFKSDTPLEVERYS